MNFFLELRRHGKLAEKRHPMYEKNKFGKFWMYFMAIFWAGYLIFFGTMFAFAFDGGAVEPYHVLNSGLVFVFFLDFLFRFPFQKIPTQEMKPYMLLPVKRNRLIDFLLIRSGISSFNLVWLFLFVPFAVITIARFYGLAGVLTYCVGIWLLAVVNNYWFLLCRTLMGERFWWILLPVVVYGAVACALFLPEESPLFDWSVNLGESFIHGDWLAFVATLLVMTLLWLVNHRLMQRLVYNEMSKVEDTTVQVKHVSEYKFLDRYGEIGEYMRLELKLLLRNKICRRSLYMVIGVTLMFSLLISFSDVYQGGMKDFLVLYNFVVFGIMFLSGIMSYEGNYIDGLMSRKESILSLLKAKYYLYSAGLLLPMLLTVPAIVMGKTTFMTSLSWLVFIPGFVYFCLFQLAVYNTKTIDLNTKLTSRQNVGTGLQNLIAGAAMGMPLVLLFVLNALVGREATPWILIVIGLGFILTSRLWIRHVYQRFMKRRYQNMEGFRDSRQN